MWFINAQIEYCFVQKWTPPDNFETYFPIGSKPVTVQYENYQYPCNFDVTYTTKLLAKNEVATRDQTVPSFIN